MKTLPRALPAATIRDLRQATAADPAALLDPVAVADPAADPTAVLDPVASTAPEVDPGVDPVVDPGVDPGVGGGASRVMWMQDTARPSGGHRVATREKDEDAEVWMEGAEGAPEDDGTGPPGST